MSKRLGNSEFESQLLELLQKTPLNEVLDLLGARARKQGLRKDGGGS